MAEKKGGLEPRGCWLLLFWLMEVLNFTPGCNWSSCWKGMKPKDEGAVGSLSCHRPLWECQWLFPVFLATPPLCCPCEYSHQPAPQSPTKQSSTRVPLPACNA